MRKSANRVTEAEQYLLDKIRRGSEQAWSEFVDRYRGRLLSFARTKLLQQADAEDGVQETFIAFIKSLPSYRGECSLETYLFTLLRRKIIDTYRGRNARHTCLLQDTYDVQGDERPSDPFAEVAGPEQTASWYVRADEKCEMQKAALADGISNLVDGFRKSLNFRDLQITELLFYCQLSNKDVARITEMNEKAIALIKHRSLKQIREHVESSDIPLGPSSAEFENILTETWEFQRPSCPKRSTIGAHLLGTLDEGWNKYVDFHVNTLGCKFCRANLEDLKTESSRSQNTKFRARIMESTAGFLSRHH